MLTPITRDTTTHTPRATHGKNDAITVQERTNLLHALQWMQDQIFGRGDVYDFDATLGKVFIRFGSLVRVFDFGISATYLLYAGKRLNLSRFQATNIFAH